MSMGSGSTDNPAADASLALQQQQQTEANNQAAIARQQQVQAIQGSVSTDTWNLLKQFGQRSASATSATPVTPLSPTTGGFALLNDVRQNGFAAIPDMFTIIGQSMSAGMNAALGKS